MPETLAVNCCTADGADTVAVTRARMLAAVSPLERTEQIPLHAALGRVLAGPVQAVADSPPNDNSAMDGYALRAAEAEAADGVLPVSQRIPAGHAPEALAIGTAARIFTGGVIPEGADTVVMQERCREVDAMVEIEGSIRVDENIRRAGEDLQRGATVLAAGQRMRPQDIGLAATAGAGHLRVHGRPRVAILVTGDELVSPGKPLPDGGIFNSNGPLLQALVQALGCEVQAVRQVQDTAGDTRAALASVARDVDLILASGGISVGEEDHVRAAVEALGHLDFCKVSMKPGKPLAFGRVGETPLLGFPGNPVSLFVTFALFGAPLLRRLQGRTDVFPAPVRWPTGFIHQRPGKREEYQRVRIVDGRLAAFAHQGSGVFSSVQWADGLAVIPAGTTLVEGDGVDYYGFTELLA